jgi:hypothetical protein
MRTRTRIPAAAPAWVRTLVAGPERPARVVHRGADAVYLALDRVCLGVLSTRATAVPCAARTTVEHLPAALVEEPVGWVGEGRIALGGVDVVVARTVEATVPRLGLSAVDLALRRLTGCVGDAVQHVRDELPAAALDGLATGRPDAAAALLGRGSGLTPVGDDVLAGWLATTGAYDGRAGAAAPGASPVADAVADQAPAATTLLSATLLDCARRGEVIPQFRAVLLDLADPRTPRVDDSVAALLTVGHTSGAGMVLGTLLALRHLASRRTP